MPSSNTVLEPLTATGTVRLAVWHRLNGIYSVGLLVAHTLLIDGTDWAVRIESFNNQTTAATPAENRN